ncbi:hypothetical protein FBU30_004464 [Linnemannia zychae]|nr:hypothetical protein FBU30_004464 [Linnemannia zychae]
MATTSTQKRAMHDALSLSEIRTHIGFFLLPSKKDVIACMYVSKDWRNDFRRLLYRHLVLDHRTFHSILGSLQWRAYGVYTHSLDLEEPAVMQKVNPNSRGGYGKLSGGGYRSFGSGGSSTAIRSADYNLDAVQHCPNLTHLSVRLNPAAQGLCCWTREDDNDSDFFGQDYKNSEDCLSGTGPQPPPPRFRTSVAFRYDRQNVPWFVKSSNRILALLEYHPNLQSFSWIGDSSLHLERIGQHLLTKKHHLVNLQLDSLKATCAELNRIIGNCPFLQRLSLKSFFLTEVATWPDLEIENNSSKNTSTISPSSIPLPSPPSILNLAQIRSLTLDRPQLLAPGILIVQGPALHYLELIDCAFPPSFLAEVERAHVEGTLLTIPPYVIEWNCPKLTTFKHERGAFMPETFTHHLFESAQGSLRSLTLHKLTLYPAFVSDLITLDILCQQLTHIDLSGSERIKSTELQRLLCHCPSLLEIKGPAGVLWGEDLFQSEKSWACLQLRKLQILIILARPDSGLWDADSHLMGFPLWDNLPVDSNRFIQIQKAVFEQLGRLTHLETMDLSGEYGVEHFLHEVPRGIPWTLDVGLDVLKNLKKMKELVVSGWENKMTRREAQWFGEQWPELRSVRTTNEIHAFAKRRPSQQQLQQQQQQRQQLFDETLPVCEEQVVGWLAFRICLHQEWPERFPEPHVN